MTTTNQSNTDSAPSSQSSSPYLPAQTFDPGIPHKWRRPSVRERGLIIAILVISLLGLVDLRFNYTSGGALEDVVANAMYQNGWTPNSDTSDSIFADGYGAYRTEVFAASAKGGTILYSVVTNNNGYVIPISGVDVSQIPSGVEATYISGAQSIAPGDAQVVAVWLDGVDKVSDEELKDVAFDSYSTADSTGTLFEVVVTPEDSHRDSIVSAYEPIARAQLKEFQSAQSE